MKFNIKGAFSCNSKNALETLKNISTKFRVFSILTAHNIWADDDFLDDDFLSWIDGTLKTSDLIKPYSKYDYSEEEDVLLEAWHYYLSSK